MVMAKLHVICGNCGCADLWELSIVRDGDDISSDHEAYEDSASLYCGNCSTLHNLKDSAKKVTFGSGATIPVPARQPEEIAPDIVEAAHEVTRALTALRHTRDAFEIGGLIRSDINSICDVLDVTASKLFQIAKGGENER